MEPKLADCFYPLSNFHAESEEKILLLTFIQSKLIAYFTIGSEPDPEPHKDFYPH
jgi:hypothetical protein